MDTGYINEGKKHETYIHIRIDKKKLVLIEISRSRTSVKASAYVKHIQPTPLNMPSSRFVFCVLLNFSIFCVCCVHSANNIGHARVWRII